MGAVGPAGSEGSQVDTIYLFVCLFVYSSSCNFGVLYLSNILTKKISRATL